MVTSLLGKLWKIHDCENANSIRCAFEVPEQRIMVNLDEEKGRPPRAQPDNVYVVIRKSKTIRMAVLSAYLTRQMPFDNSVLEAISK
jgi:hypothetical protein